MMRSCNPVEISSKSAGIASKIIGTCGAKEHTWYVLNKTNQKNHVWKIMSLIVH